MEDLGIEDLKRLRSSLKTKITTAGSRLTGAINKKLVSSLISQFYTELETHYLDFTVADQRYNNELESDRSLVEKYEVVNNLNLTQYTETVDGVYMEARQVHDEYIQSVQQKKNETLVNGIAGNVHRICSRFDVVIIRLSSLLSVEEADLTELLVDKEELETLTAQLISYLDKVVQFPEANWDEVTQLIQEKISVSDEKRRLVNIKVKQTLVTTSCPQSSIPSMLNSVTSSPLVISGNTNKTLNSFALSSPVTTSIGITPTTSQQTAQVSLAHLNHLSNLTSSSGTTMSTGMTLTGSSVSSLGMYPKTSVLASLLPETSASVATSSVPAATQPAEDCPAPSYSYPEVKIKRAELPTFSGLREDWPEFKTLWPRLALPAFSSRETLALELRRCLVGETAKNQVKCIPITGPHSFDIMWNRLSLFYEDPSASVDAALRRLECLRPVAEEDYRALWDFIDRVEISYSQLTTIDQIGCLTLRDVDNLCALLPSSLKRAWHRRYHRLTTAEKIRPFPSFMLFLTEERMVISRLVEQCPVGKSGRGLTSHHTGVTGNRGSEFLSKYKDCAFHGEDGEHVTSDCVEFRELDRSEKFEKLKSVSACFRCFGKHYRSECQANDPCDTCGSTGHHTLLCRNG